MENKVKDVYENIKDRLSNPLIFSFICSWLILNWKIPVALIWYDKSQFARCGCFTIFDFIDWHLKNESTFWHPVIIAVIYTVAIPFVKNGIRIVSAYAQKWGEKEEIKALDGGKIGIDKYLDLREDYKKKIKDLENVANEEKKYLDENSDLLIEINESKGKFNELLSERNSLNELINKMSDSSFLNGRWITNSNDSEFSNRPDSEKNIYILNDDYFENEDGKRKFVITDFYYSISQQKIFFIKLRANHIAGGYSKNHLINILNVKKENGVDVLEGIQNNVPVKYTRYEKIFNLKAEDGIIDGGIII